MGLPVNVEYTAEDGHRLRPVVEMLEGIRRTADEQSLWNEASSRMSFALGGKTCRVEAATLSPTGKHLAICSEVKSMLGLRARHAAGILSLSDRSLIGRVPEGKRHAGHWKKGA